MEIFDPDPSLTDIIRQILSHALCQRCDQDLIVAFHLLVDLSDEIVDLALHRTDLHSGVQQSRGPDDLLHDLPRALARRMEESGARLIALDAIKLVESGLGALCDVTVAVTAPEEVRVRRIMTRDGISEDYARARVRAQRSEEAFRADCDAVFENNYPTPAQAAFAAEEFLDTIIKKSKEE